VDPALGMLKFTWPYAYRVAARSEDLPFPGSTIGAGASRFRQKNRLLPVLVPTDLLHGPERLGALRKDSRVRRG
jgi:hypothetical protein